MEKSRVHLEGSPGMIDGQLFWWREVSLPVFCVHLRVLAAAPRQSRQLFWWGEASLPVCIYMCPSLSACIYLPACTCLPACIYPSFPACVYLYMCRVGQNCIYTPYMTVYLVISLQIIPYIHRIYMVLANPIYVSFLCVYLLSSQGKGDF